MSRDVLARYTTPHGNVVTPYRVHDRDGWATCCELLGGEQSLVFIPERKKAREHYDLAKRVGSTFGGFR